MSELDDLVARNIQATREKNQRLTPNTNVSPSIERDHTKNSVVKSNELARAYYKVTLNEKRLMELLISLLNPKRTDNEYRNIEITRKLFIDTFKIKKQNGFRDLVNAAYGLQEVFIKLKDDPDDRRGSRFNIISNVSHDTDRALIICSINSWAIPHLVNMRGKFTRYTLRNGADFKNPLVWRIYELIVSWSNTKEPPLRGSKTISVDDLRERLGIPESYPYSMFKRRVLVVSQKELKEKLNINFTWSELKNGKKVAELKFKFKEDEQTQLSFDGATE